MGCPPPPHTHTQGALLSCGLIGWSESWGISTRMWDMVSKNILKWKRWQSQKKSTLWYQAKLIYLSLPEKCFCPTGQPSNKLPELPFYTLCAEQELRYMSPYIDWRPILMTSELKDNFFPFCFGSISQVLLKILLISLSKALSLTALEALSHRLSSFQKPRPFLSALTSALCSRLWRRQRRRESGRTAMGPLRARPSLRTSSFTQ